MVHATMVLLRNDVLRMPFKRPVWKPARFSKEWIYCGVASYSDPRNSSLSDLCLAHHVCRLLQLVIRMQFFGQLFHYPLAKCTPSWNSAMPLVLCEYLEFLVPLVPCFVLHWHVAGPLKTKALTLWYLNVSARCVFSLQAKNGRSYVP